MWTKKFWMDAAERAIKTAAQTLIGAIGGLTAIDEFDWAAVGIATGVATLLSLLTSIVSSQVGTPADASLVNQPQPVPPTTLAGGGVGK